MLGSGPGLGSVNNITYWRITAYYCTDINYLYPIFPFYIQLTRPDAVLSTVYISLKINVITGYSDKAEHQLNKNHQIDKLIVDKKEFAKGNLH